MSTKDKTTTSRPTCSSTVVKCRFEIGKFYQFKYLYNQKECESEGVFEKEDFGKLYFRNNYDWTVVLINSIIWSSNGT